MKTQPQGFTLLELLVALSLMVAVVAALVSGLRFESRLLTRTQQDLATGMRLIAFQDSLRGWIQQSYPFTDITSDRRVTYPLEGSATAIKFSAPLFVGGMADGIYRLRLGLTPDSRSIVLQAVIDRNGQYDPELRDGPIVKELLSGVDVLEISYLEDTRSGRRWLSNWQRQVGLPVAIRVRYRGKVTMMEWREIIVRPRISREAKCEFDPVSRDCRV